MDDTDSLAAFQNPAATLAAGTGLETMAEKLKAVEVVENAHVPSLEPAAPQVEELGPYGRMIKPSGPSPEELQRAAEKEEREHIISRLTRLNHKPNFPRISFNPVTDNLHTLRRLNRLATHTGRLRMSVNFMKRATIFFCRLIEGLTLRFPVLKKYGLNLEGFSEHLMLTINSFDSVLEDVYDFYSDTIVECSPLLIYVGSIGSQMMVYSATKTIMAKTQDVAKRKREQEQKRRDEEIAELMRVRLKRSGGSGGGGMSGPSDVPASELDDNVSVGFESVKSETMRPPTSPSRSVTFAETPRVLNTSESKRKEDEEEDGGKKKEGVSLPQIKDGKVTIDLS